MRVLVGGFRGSTNSAGLIIEKIESRYELDRLYLINSFSACKDQLEKQLKQHVYNLVILFGQKPGTEAVYLEQRACINGEELLTNHNYELLGTMLSESGFKYVISNNAGNYLCNHIYYHGLKFISEYDKKPGMIFIHIPGIKNIMDMDGLARVFTAYIDEYCNRLSGK